MNNLESELEDQLKTLLYCCDGLCTAQTEGDEEDIQKWLHNVIHTYEAYKEVKDGIEEGYLNK